MPPSFINQNFLELPTRYSHYEKARYAVLPIPYDAAVSYNPGARRAPCAIIDASHHVELLDDELLRSFHKSGIATLPPLASIAAGPKEMHDAIHSAARRIVRDGKTLLGVGGDHSVTSGLVRAVKSRHKKLSVLQIDAHLDLRDTFEDSPYSHATVMRRVTELDVNVVPVGIRAIDPDELRFARKNDIEIVTARECHTSDEWVDGVIDRLADNVYITIDIDGFDPAYAPGTGTPEPGGLDWYQVTGLLRMVAAKRNVVAADIVEVLPLPGQVVTEFLAARLLYKLICYIEAERT